MAVVVIAEVHFLMMTESATSLFGILLQMKHPMVALGLGNRITQPNTDVIMTYVYRTSLGKLRLGTGAAASVTLMVIALTFTLVTKKLTNYGSEE